MEKVSKAERVASRGIDVSNRISERLHALSTVCIKVGVTISLDHCAAYRQNRSNNDFGPRHASLVTGRKWKNEQFDKPIGFFI